MDKKVPNNEVIFHNNGQLSLNRGFCTTELFEELKKEVQFVQESILMFGKKVQVPRLVAYQGDASYTYSGNYHPPTPFTDKVNSLKKKIEKLTQSEFNAVLMNLYRNGEDYMGYHADNEPEIDQSCIASLSFGSTRKMKFKHRHSGIVHDVLLHSGDLMLMYNCQSHWVHSIPKTKKISTPRLNLTFRKIRK